MEKPKIIAYLKPTCGWSQGVRAVLRKYDLPFEDRDIINDPLQRQEMIEKTGQMLSPCVEINGHMLPDISGEEVEAWMLANKIVSPNDREAGRADEPALRPRNAGQCAVAIPELNVWRRSMSVAEVFRRSQTAATKSSRTEPSARLVCWANRP